MSVLKPRMLAASGVASLLLCGLGQPATAQAPAPSPAPAPAQAAPPAPAPSAAPPASSAPTAAPSTGGEATLPDVNITAPKVTRPKRPVTRVTTNKRNTQSPVTPPPQTQEQKLAGTNDKFDEARRSLVAPTGAGTYQLSRQNLAPLPQGTNTPLDKALLQAPGVSQDSAASGDLPVRNEH